MNYSDVCEAKTRAEMLSRFDALLKEISKSHGGTPESHRKIQLSNVGYFSGYYDGATAARVVKWLGATHPIFGTSHADGTLTPQAAFNAGKAMGRKAKAAKP
jgi:hypothetical protein